MYKLWYETRDHLPKKSKFTLGTKIDLIFNNILELIFVAGNLPKDQKLPYLQKAISQFDLLKFFLRVVWEVKAIDNNNNLQQNSSMKDEEFKRKKEDLRSLGYL